jgi:hypothetical protein
MTKILKKVAYVFCVPLIALLLIFSPVFVSNAATLSSAYVMLSRMKADLTSTANLEIYIAFKPSGNVSSGSTLTLEFPDADDTDWCNTAGSDLTVAGVTSTPADSTGDYDIDAALPGTLNASCSQGSGSSSVDTITITGITALTSSNTYGVKLSNGSTAKLGTSSAGSHVVTLTVDDGSDPETKSFGVYLVSSDQVEISAEVLDPPTITCSLSTNSVNLGNMYRGGSYVTGTHTLSVSTSDNAAGYAWMAYGQGDGSTNAGLYKSTATTYLIESDNSGSTVDISDPGSEGFGMNVEVPTEGAVAGTGFVDNDPGVFGSLGMGPSNAELIAYRNWGPQETTADITITYGARAGSSAEAGSYGEVVTFVCGGYFGTYESDPYLVEADTGWTNPGTMGEIILSGSDGGWINLDNAKSSNNSYARSEWGESSGYYTDYLYASNFSFSLPTNSTVDGIEVRIERYATDGEAKDYRVSLVNQEATVTTEDKSNPSNWSSSDPNSYTTYGSSTNLWEETWTYSDINDSDFGIGLSAIGTNPDDGSFINVDNIQMKVYYTY